MAADLLVTKYRLPPTRPPGRLVARPRLLDQLDRGLGGRLVLLSAPAGYGKTTLLSEWLSRTTGPITGCRKAWLSLDAADNDPVRFWTYVAAATEAAIPGIDADARQLLHAPQTPPLESIVTLLINHLAQAAGRLLLVLDDFHLIQSSAIQDSLTYLLDGLPAEAGCLVIATRTDPFGLPLARLRARGQLLEIRAADLRFTADEAAAFLQQVMGLPLSIDEIARLKERTEGWIAGLQMAALSSCSSSACPSCRPVTASHNGPLN